MMALSFLYVLCMWLSFACPSLGTGFAYHFPGITLQRQRIKSEQSGSTGPPGTRSHTQLSSEERPAEQLVKWEVDSLSLMMGSTAPGHHRPQNLRPVKTKMFTQGRDTTVSLKKQPRGWMEV
ncbi:hypothetical protein EYF80_009421 [Liparis tanakae]|uniref:Uncharacterized protein n=1 Tax=Liparis tanakae TaxID=230148 RepID=A0A4Z2IRK6_9TELE|nr:hypothetical protein EYF80_009421 [Liparis tanakae]